jgi:hypothetical protein
MGQPAFGVRRLFILLALGVLTALAITLVAGHHSWSGPELLALSPTHGLNLFDIPVVAVWMVAAGCAWRMWRRR